ncbi:MAG: transcription termination/antitermination protein NusA, partial [Dehalococcoidia bacterium]|nr:transcription termination/antitermination protein NusA [Dehalococcoidia bacterium]
MKTDFLLAITQLAAERNLPKEVVIAAIESALVSAFRKDNFATNRNISVKIDPETGKVKVLAEKT